MSRGCRTIAAVNAMGRAEFVREFGPVFEHSPWIAQRGWDRRPFLSLADLHAKLCDVVRESSAEEQMALIRAHPDLVGRMAREGKLTAESAREQSAAGLTGLSAEEIERFERHNAEYRGKFGFPFVICARENRKDAILAAFPRRLRNTVEEEIATALAEIFKIARLRLMDLIEESA